MHSHVINAQERVPKAAVASWSNITFIYAIEHELVQSATRVWSFGHMLGQGDIPFSDEAQQQLLCSCIPRVNVIMDTAYRLTVWASTHAGIHLHAKRAVPDLPDVLTWSPDDVIMQTYRALREPVGYICTTIALFTEPHSIFSNEHQRNYIMKLQKDSKRVARIVDYMDYWLSSH